MRRWMLAAVCAVLGAGCRYEAIPGGTIHSDDDEFSTVWRLDRWTGELCWFVADDLSQPVEDPPTLQGCASGVWKPAPVPTAGRLSDVRFPTGARARGGRPVLAAGHD